MDQLNPNEPGMAQTMRLEHLLTSAAAVLFVGVAPSGASAVTPKIAHVKLGLWDFTTTEGLLYGQRTEASRNLMAPGYGNRPEGPRWH